MSSERKKQQPWMHLGVVVKSSAVMRGDIKNSTVASQISTVLGLRAALEQKGLAGRGWGRGRKTCIIMPSLLAKEKCCKAEMMASRSFFGRSQAGVGVNEASSQKSKSC